jgi:sensitive to high expression protein 9
MTTDEAIEQEFQNLTRAILNRYHEEQVWSDKIRSASTYGSLLALGLNVVVFVLAIIVVEPYKRKRMAETFEKRIEQLSLETKDMVQTISSHVDAHLIKQESILVPLTASHALQNDEPAAKPANHFTTVPVERREMISAVIGAVATLTVVGLLSLLRR